MTSGSDTLSLAGRVKKFKLRKIHRTNTQQHSCARTVTMTEKRSDHDKQPDKGKNRPERVNRDTAFPIIENSSSSHRRSPSPGATMDLDIESILKELPNPWRVEAKTHLPLHIEGGCEECKKFLRHVVENTRGGGFIHFVSLMKDHWRKEMEDDLNEAFDQGWRKAQLKYEAHIDDLHMRINELLDRNEELKEINDQIRAGSSDAPRTSKWERPVSTERNPSEGGEPPLVKKTKTRDASKNKEKQKDSQGEEEDCQPRKRMGMYDHSSSDDDFSYNAREAEEEIDEQLESERHMERLSEDEEAAHPQITKQPVASSLAATKYNVPPVVEPMLMPSDGPASYSNALLNRISDVGVRPTPHGQMPPDPPSDKIRGPARFDLGAWEHARLNANGHVSVLKESYWGENISMLCRKETMKWRTGRLNKLVVEASRIPFDQRSYLQRWAVKTATKEGIIPDSTLSREPDVEDPKTLETASQHLRRDTHGRYYVEDITAWLLLSMTQPEAREGNQTWFWFASCLLFARIGKYDDVLSQRGLNGNDRGRIYAPWRFVKRGPWTDEDLAVHFYNCGVRTRQASTCLHDFAERWLGNRPVAPREPNWDLCPDPRELVNRKRPQSRKKYGKRLLQAQVPLDDPFEQPPATLNYGEPEAIDMSVDHPDDNSRM